MRSKGGGHKLGSSILDSEPKWRCEVCTFINRMTAEACGRCREPVDEEERARLKLRVEKPAPKAKAAPPAAALPRRTAARDGPAPSTRSGPEGAARRGSGQARAKPKKSGVHTMAGKSKPAASVRRTHFGGMHKGDLGYKPAKGGNVKGMTRSRLNEATASYSAKFEKEGDGKPARSGNIHTIGSGNVNGFTKSSAAIKAEATRRAARNPHDEKAAPRPAKYAARGLGAKCTGKRQTGLMARLQKAATSAAVASLKHTGRAVQPSVKTSHGQATKFAL